ncbi:MULTISPECIES: hypothetical protein [Pseudomonas]|uniref:Nucleotidyl transferase AbiEii toxin, Type IV TA system n=1 Tax=Pseudomonas asplenii TaxID=53407 RepID=A0A0N0E5A1_9PSED|nr:hypothetical protein [Pseudomonas fuscovaginae]KPA92238.1 hypothetical protein PF66_00911 [Pseudomonas fuscovaginae]KPA94858.1 hypothetical protein PF70_05147 [Pseudomonas fuscovaginae]
MAIVRGLERFGKHFSEYKDKYVLIGGVASALTMDDAGRDFRATKDLDIVLIIEALDTAFVARFWDFVKAGGYQIKQAGGERPVFYRFQHPTDESYPVQIELFSRTPEGLEHEENATLTPIPTDESVSSLSAILLDDAYYEFLLDGRQQNDELSYISADRLIPLKARAWLDLSKRKDTGEKIDSRNVRKHRNDVLVLAGLLSGEPIELTEIILADMKEFLERLAKEEVNLKDIGLRGSLAELISRLEQSFGLVQEQAAT